MVLNVIRGYSEVSCATPILMLAIIATQKPHVYCAECSKLMISLPLSLEVTSNVACCHRWCHCYYHREEGCIRSSPLKFARYTNALSTPIILILHLLIPQRFYIYEFYIYVLVVVYAGYGTKCSKGPP